MDSGQFIGQRQRQKFLARETIGKEIFFKSGFLHFIRFFFHRNQVFFNNPREIVSIYVIGRLFWVNRKFEPFRYFARDLSALRLMIIESDAVSAIFGRSLDRVRLSNIVEQCSKNHLSIIGYFRKLLYKIFFPQNLHRQPRVFKDISFGMPVGRLGAPDAFEYFRHQDFK